ncbi:uncharacterized protein LOC129694853 [Leucoraja erinacea]|uniref:uncharacterized protein LOC129694853 n=1 Tax=Leucoraja erinaceus TaxID=7782 RepID=UPI0024562502|nr:uncharacterized protein LOC129694853 [Leucoraja erinacea]
MGSDYSKDGCVHNPPMDERNLKVLKDYLRNYELPKGHEGYVNILMFGMVGAGKSSTINTFLSALDPNGRTTTCVPTGTNPDSLTTELRSYKLGKLKFWDTAGWNALEPCQETKVLLRLILEGRIPIGTNLHDFIPTSAKVNPVILGNVIHGVAFVFDTTVVDKISDDIMKQFQDLQTIVAQKCVYRVVIGTKFENLGIEEKNHAWIYEYKPLQQKFIQLSASTGINKQCMFVVSNQWNGDQITMIKQILALYVLEHMIRNIDRYLKTTA